MKQRELKFRVWDGERMHNVSGQGLHLIFWNDPTRIGWGLYDASEAKLTDSQYGIASVMQFTGLQDKNGKDVYEGDLLSFPALNKMENYRKGAPAPATEVKWDGYQWAGLILAAHGFEIEVIGNRFENPELLPTNTTEG